MAERMKEALPHHLTGGLEVERRSRTGRDVCKNPYNTTHPLPPAVEKNPALSSNH